MELRFKNTFSSSSLSPSPSPSLPLPLPLPFLSSSPPPSDLPVQLNQAKFEFNGGTGYIQKPWVMMREGGGAGIFNPFTQIKLEDIVPATLSIKVTRTCIQCTCMSEYTRKALWYTGLSFKYTIQNTILY